MNNKQSALSVEYKVNFGNGYGNRKTGKQPRPPKTTSPKIPRITKLLALAHHLQDLLDQGVVKDYADIARLSGLSRPRITQIMNLTMLAPTIQEEILFPPNSFLGGINERNLRKILTTPVWQEQAKIWEEIKTTKPQGEENR